MPHEIESLGVSGSTMDQADGLVVVTTTYIRCPLCGDMSGLAPCEQCKPNGKICIPCYRRGGVIVSEPVTVTVSPDPQNEPPVMA